MDRQHVVVMLNKEECLQQAEGLFLRASGLNQQGAKFERMRQDAFAALDRLERNIDIKVVYRVIESAALEGKQLCVEGMEISCAGFEQIPPESIESVVVYALTAGNYEVAGADFFDQCYADLWGTAFTEAAFTVWREKMSKKHALSDCFGPGYFGMDVSQLDYIAALADSSSIGLRVTDAHVILPQKSCMGLFFYVNQRYKPLSSACKYCSGNKHACRLCNAAPTLPS